MSLTRPLRAPQYEEDPPWFGTSARPRRDLETRIAHAPQLTHSLRRSHHPAGAVWHACVPALWISRPFCGADASALFYYASAAKYDNGERWDLKAKYTDEGYEDADADVMGKFMALFKPKSNGKDGDK